MADELCGSRVFQRFEPTPIAGVPASGRKALVVGISNYESLQPLPNPANDARDMATKLSHLGFAGGCGIDISRDQFVSALENLRDDITKSDTAFVYFAGHGASVDSDNYLAVTNTSPHDPHAFKTSAIGVMDNIVRTLLTGQPRRVVVVTDACRNEIRWRQATGRRGDGLADSFLPVPIPLGNENPSLFVAYGTGYGMWADDGNGKNGMFTARLIARLDRNIENDLRDIWEDVESDLDEQRPERVVYGFGDRFYPRPPAPIKVTFDQRVDLARQALHSFGCKSLRDVALAYEEWWDNSEIASDYKSLTQELDECKNRALEPLVAQLSENVTVDDADQILLAARSEELDRAFVTTGGGLSIPDIGFSVEPNPPLSPRATGTMPRSNSVVMNSGDLGELDATDKARLQELVTSGGGQIFVTVGVPRRQTFKDKLETDVRIAHVLETFVDLGVALNRVELRTGPSEFLTKGVLVQRTN